MNTTISEYEFISTCMERGYDIEDVEPCVVSKEGTQWTVDVDSPFYPKERPAVSIMGVENVQSSDTNITYTATGSFKIVFPPIQTDKGMLQMLPVVLNNPVFTFSRYMNGVFATTKNLPLTIVVFTPKYASTDNPTDQEITEKLKEILGDNPQEAIQSILDARYS